MSLFNSKENASGYYGVCTSEQLFSWESKAPTCPGRPFTAASRAPSTRLLQQGGKVHRRFIAIFAALLLR